MEWSLYDRLIAAVPDDIFIDDAAPGPHWTMVRAGGLVGCAMHFPVETIPPLHPNGYQGLSLRAAAACAKSWNLTEASVGVAALNAFYNQTEQAEMLAQNPAVRLRLSQEDAFFAHLDELRGKKVAVIGHFRHLERIAPVCQLSVLERNPGPGDYPDSACEYLLPEQDFVFITGSTLVNKTLPRLLALSKNAYTIVVGPSTTLSPLLLEYGANELNALALEDGASAYAMASAGGTGGGLAKHGRRFELCAK